ncbi:energy-coupling factor transporter transmembrane component T family protein [Caldinitratiruptor microaerophilus]|uniref:Cobalt ABC transporter permease n=1 Tax=Caldinitratiruptor microaerophilus TaxID=671077 RepID=A0AA35CL49_9FIRM|nr:energy-coupling factor transporter transmembrane component T [Caldinitratiruptor microaerophilus]BDG61319.1 cobalt ABC transporter permease [Caldinitratiruptor microaerophilus]
MDIYFYVPGDSILHRLDPRTKMFLLLAVLLLAVATDTPLLPGALVAASLLGAAVARAWPALRRVRVLVGTVFTVSMGMWSLLAQGRTPLLGPVEVESVLFGVATGLKLSAMIVSSVLFLATTRNEEIAAGLIRLGVPYSVGFAFSTALRLVPTFVGAGVTIIQAQKSRGLDVESGGLITRMRKHLPLMVPVFASALRSTNQFAMALESKGFGARPRRTDYLQLRFTLRDWLWSAAAAVGAAVALYLRFTGAGSLSGLVR